MSCTLRYSRRGFSSSEGGIDQEQQAAAPAPRQGGAAPQIALLFSFQSISKTQNLHFAAFDSGNVPGFRETAPESFHNAKISLRKTATAAEKGV